MKRTKAKTKRDIVRHFRKRCLQRIGFVLNQEILKSMVKKNEIEVIRRQSNRKTRFKLKKHTYKGKFNVGFDVELIYDKARHAFVTCWKYGK